MILVIIDCLRKMIYYKLVKTSIKIARLGKVIIDIVVKYHDFTDQFYSIKILYIPRSSSFCDIIFTKKEKTIGYSLLFLNIWPN